MPKKKESRPMTANRRATIGKVRNSRGYGARVSINEFNTAFGLVNIEEPKQRILLPMIVTARRNGWHQIAGAVSALDAHWTRRGER
jgi:hypothetical protein